MSRGWVWRMLSVVSCCSSRGRERHNCPATCDDDCSRGELQSMASLYCTSPAPTQWIGEGGEWLVALIGWLMVSATKLTWRRPARCWWLPVGARWLVYGPGDGRAAGPSVGRRDKTSAERTNDAPAPTSSRANFLIELSTTTTTSDDGLDVDWSARISRLDGRRHWSAARRRAGGDRRARPSTPPPRDQGEVYVPPWSMIWTRWKFSPS